MFDENIFNLEQILNCGRNKEINLVKGIPGYVPMEWFDAKSIWKILEDRGVRVSSYKEKLEIMMNNKEANVYTWLFSKNTPYEKFDHLVLAIDDKDTSFQRGNLNEKISLTFNIIRDKKGYPRALKLVGIKDESFEYGYLETRFEEKLGLFKKSRELVAKYRTEHEMMLQRYSSSSVTPNQESMQTDNDEIKYEDYIKLRNKVMEKNRIIGK